MARSPTTSSVSGSSLDAWNRYYIAWCKDRKEFGLPCCRKEASREWKRLSPDEKAMYYVRRRDTPKPAHVTGPLDSPYDDEDIVNNVVSLIATPVAEKEELPLSPLFSESGSFVGPSFLDEFLPGPDQVSSTSPSHFVLELPFPGPSTTNEVEPSSTTGQPYFTAPVLSLPLPESLFQDGTDISILDESAYNYSVFPPDTAFTSPEENWWDLNFSDLPSAMIPAETSGSSLVTPVPITPTTGYTAPGLATSGYTPGLFTQDLPAEFGDNQYAFNGAEGAVPEQPMWNTYQDFGHIGQQPLAPPTPVLPTFAPPPVATGQFDQTNGFQDYQHLPWNNSTQVPGNDGLQPPQFFVPNQCAQNVPHTPIQQTFNVVNTCNCGQGGKPVRIGTVGVQLWFAPT